MITLPMCRWRDEAEQERHLCTAPHYLNAPSLVTAEFCMRCGYADRPAPPALPSALPCVHLGAAHIQAGRVFWSCALHGRCRPDREPGDGNGVRSCSACADYLAGDPFGPDSSRMRDQADALLRELPAYPAGRYRGRGVIIAGGGDRFFASLYIGVRALRHVGCRLPIQVWYLGRDDELPPDRRALLEPYDVECVDADAVRRRHPARNLGGWELKVFATLQSRFEEVLFLDADCYPCRNPELLFDDADYRARGAVFWPDLTLADGRLRWPAFHVAGPVRPGSVESGQYLVHKRRCWRPLNLAWFYNDHSDFYYRYCYGDKHTFEVAWTRCRQPYAMWQPTARWAEVAYVHVGPDERPLFVHRCSAKFAFKPEPYSTPQRHAGQAYQRQLPLERACWQWLGELTRTVAEPELRQRGALVPDRIVRVGLPEHFNGSVALHDGRRLLASRQGSALFLSELDRAYQPLRTWPLRLVHPRASHGAEDPRLFFYRGQLHCAFTGVVDARAARHIDQLVCRLDRNRRVDKIWLPRFSGRQFWEKNWQFFEHAGRLYSIYSIDPHVILLHRRDRAIVAARTVAPLPWRDVHLRGGAPPIRVGDEYYHFFHTMRAARGMHEYGLGLYTFSARPPFAIQRLAPDLLLTPSAADRPSGFAKSVVFPCGALRQGRTWIISYGYHDHECRIAFFAAEAIERCLRPVLPAGSDDRRRAARGAGAT